VVEIPSKEKAMFFVRLLSGIVLVLVTACTHYIGGPLLLVFTLLLSMVANYEFMKVANLHKTPLTIFSLLSILVYYILVYFKLESLELMTIVFAIIAMACFYIVAYPKYLPEQISHTVLSIVYTGIMMSFIYRTRVLENGLYLVWLIYLSSWGSDTFAYLTGITLGRGGKHKLTPKLSPKKSVEGFFGGIIGAAVLGMVFGLVIKNIFSINMTYPMLICGVVCALAGVLSVAGDLIASAFKRHYNIKDYGKLIPGHGGILDRYDSVLFTAPCVYYAIIIINILI